MTWLQPWAWLGLGALAVPVLVHLFSRRPARTEAFPSLRFLAVTPLRPTRRTRVSDWPLLVVRLATLLAAVAALAQPLRHATGAAAQARPSRVLLLDSMTAASASYAATNDSVVLLRTGNIADGLAQAVALLHALPAPRQLEVVSSFAETVADSSMFAALPRDVALTLTPAAAPSVSVDTRDTLGWHTMLGARDVATISRAVALLGGAPIRLDTAAAGGVARGAPSDTRVVVAVRTPGQRAELLRRVASDAALNAIAESRSDGARPAGEAPGNARADSAVVVLVRDASGLPMVSASLTPLTVELHASFTTTSDELALLLAAGGARPAVPAAGAPDQARLARWRALPAGAAIGAGQRSPDVHRSPSDARWMWVVVLVLLAVEWVMRRGAPRAVEQA